MLRAGSSLSFPEMLVPPTLAALCGASWMLPEHPIGPILSLFFVVLVLSQNTHWMRFGVAFAYYAGGSIGLLRGVDVFFGPHAPLWEGAFLWLGSSAFLAAGWTMADRPWKAVSVLFFDAFVPPMALFDWMSPLSAAGVFFPSTGMIGLALLIMWVLIGRPTSRLRVILLEILIVAGTFTNIYAKLYPEQPPAGWQGVELHVGPAVPNVLDNLHRHTEILRETLHQSKNARVVLLPETLETDWAGNAWAIQQTMSAGQTWLVGMSVPRQVGWMTDSVVAFRHTGKPQVVFDSAFPVPVSMWHPWSRGTGYVYSQNVGYEASWWEPVKRIEGVRAWASICYDQLLPFVWAEALLQRPQVVLLTNNEWWARGTGIPAVQHNTAWAWGRLLGSPEIEAENS